MNENKRGFKAKKHKVASIAPSKPRNFVAKNATTSGAGAHKDKKKAMKQGDSKHKKDYAEHLDSMLKTAIVEDQKINEEGLSPIKRLQIIRFIANAKGWGISDLELAKDNELIYMYKKIKAGEDIDEAGYGRNKGYHQGFASPTAPRLGGGREDDGVVRFELKLGLHQEPVVVQQLCGLKGMC